MIIFIGEESSYVRCKSEHKENRWWINGCPKGEYLIGIVRKHQYSPVSHWIHSTLCMDSVFWEFLFQNFQHICQKMCLNFSEKIPFSRMHKHRILIAEWDFINCHHFHQQLTETVSTSWERLDQPPYYRYVGKLSQTMNNTVSLGGRTITPVKENVIEIETESPRLLTSERQGLEDRTGSCGSAKAFAESGSEFLPRNCCILVDAAVYF